MRIGSILENKSIEKRIAITPEIVKKYTSLGFELCLIKNYQIHHRYRFEQLVYYNFSLRGEGVYLCVCT